MIYILRGLLTFSLLVTMGALAWQDNYLLATCFIPLCLVLIVIVWDMP